MTAIQDGVNQVVLDYQGMEIIDVAQYRESDQSFVHIFSNCTSYTDQNLGSAIIIPLLQSNIFLFFTLSI